MNQRNFRRPTDLVKWESKRQDLIGKYIKSWMDILDIKADGRVSTTRIFLKTIYLRILSGYILLPDVDNVQTRSTLINIAVSKLKKRQRQDVFSFRTILAAEVRRYLQKPVQHYWVLFPLHAKPETFKKSHVLSVLGFKLHMSTWKYVRNHFAFDKFKSAAHLRLRGVTIALEADFTPILIASEGRSHEEAFDKADRAFELYRSLLNSVVNINRVSMQWGEQSPLGEIYPTPVYGIFRLDGTLDNYMYNTIRHQDYPGRVLPLKQVEAVKKLVAKLGAPSKRDETLWLIIEGLEKYGQALDTSDWRTAFLTLWQILEVLTLQSNESNMANVRNRIIGLLNQNSLDKDLLEQLYETRNTLVHRGYFVDRDGLDEVNLIKHIAEDAIGSLLSHYKSIPTRNKLAAFYDYITSSDTDLKGRVKIISYIQKLRNIKKP